MLHQVHGQQTAEGHIKCQAEARPPMWYPRIFDGEVMDEVKNSVPNQGRDHEPKTLPEADYRG